MSRVIITLKKIIELLHALDGKFVGKLIITYAPGGVVVSCRQEEELFK